MSSIQDAVACDPSRFIGAEVTAIECFESRVEFLTSRGRLVAKRAGRLQHLNRAVLEPVVWHPHGALAYRGVAAPPEGTWGTLVAIQRATHGNDTWLITITCRVVGAFLTTRSEHLFCMYAPEGWLFESMLDAPAANVGVEEPARDPRALGAAAPDDLAAVRAQRNQWANEANRFLRTLNVVAGLRVRIATSLGLNEDAGFSVHAPAGEPFVLGNPSKGTIEGAIAELKSRAGSSAMEGAAYDRAMCLNAIEKELGVVADGGIASSERQAARLAAIARLKAERDAIARIRDDLAAERDEARTTIGEMVKALGWSASSGSDPIETAKEVRSRLDGNANGVARMDLARALGRDQGSSFASLIRDVEILRDGHRARNARTDELVAELINILVVPTDRSITDVAKERMAEYRARGNSLEAIARHIGQHPVANLVTLPHAVLQLVEQRNAANAAAAAARRSWDETFDRLRAVACELGCAASGDLVEAIRIRRQVAAGHERDAFFLRICQAVGHTGTVSADILGEKVEQLVRELEEARRDLKNVSGAVGASNDDRILLGGYDETDGVAGQVVARLRQLHRERSTERATAARFERQIDAMRGVVGCSDDDSFDQAIAALRAAADDAKAMLTRVREERDAKQVELDEARKGLATASWLELSLRAQVSQMRDDAQTHHQRITVLETQNHEIAKARNDAQREAARLKAQLEATASAPAADAALAPAPRRIVDGDAFVAIMKAAESPILAISSGHDDHRWFATIRCRSGILTIRAKPQVRLERRGGYRAAGDGWVFTGSNHVSGNVLTIGTSTGFAEIVVDDRRGEGATGDAVELSWVSGDA